LFRAAKGGETARRRQNLPGRLPIVNHEEAKVPVSSDRGIITMRIYGPNGTTAGTPASSVRRTSSATFSLPEATMVPDEVRSVAAPKSAGSIDALLALQGVEDPLERRKRSVQRGRGALDVLDELKIGLLTGSLRPSTVSQLRDAAANLKSSSGDPRLDAVLAEIELRVEVELAKAGQG
jgi:hypothetical protein